ncbi:UDP-2-acetamido-2,6-beta-L-arabino-hexul-4-ose reductase [Povalibacter uvarum]|uniref:UDP-2-acetamido-2,6-beta-L-arabino-hexul-4-ose reductase n=1 Tax=Povalibacter uvarum TaxID=732238 RepID=A0A841HNU5_9GAMM|nr:cupin domain-containing protein [Povalibacter uvarum]MBB6094294.1 UDP-2-acetamido-2,6-beta-L-arabino-hexul-4-ose reductase [Povalibacter uvarum]
MTSRVQVEKLRRATDARGQVFEPLDAAGLADQRNIHVVLTGPGHIRGNHFHTRGTEVTAVAGPAHVRYRESGETVHLDIPADEVWRFTFPPGIVHAFQNTGTADLVIVSFNSIAHDPQDPDTTREVIL